MENIMNVNVGNIATWLSYLFCKLVVWLGHQVFDVKDAVTHHMPTMFQACAAGSCFKSF